jgi:hypothetical protein
MILRHSKYGQFYGCSQFPECRSTHGAHADGQPLGVPANEETKKARIIAHNYFDILWQYGTLGRSQAYQLLRNVMEFGREEAHIGKFTKEQCQHFLDKFDLIIDQVLKSYTWSQLVHATEGALYNLNKEQLLMLLHAIAVITTEPVPKEKDSPVDEPTTPAVIIKVIMGIIQKSGRGAPEECTDLLQDWVRGVKKPRYTGGRSHSSSDLHAHDLDDGGNYDYDSSGYEPNYRDFFDDEGDK